MYDEIMVNVSYKAQHPIAVVINTSEELEKNHLTYIEVVPPKGVGNMRCFPMYMAAHNILKPIELFSYIYHNMNLVCLSVHVFLSHQKSRGHEI